MKCDWKTNDFKEYRKAVDYKVIGNIFDNPELLIKWKKTNSLTARPYYQIFIKDITLD